MQRVVLFLLLMLVAAYAVGAAVFLGRDDDPLPQSADAVVVLGGSDERLNAGEALVGGGIAPTLVIAADKGRKSARRDRLCRLEEPAVICVYPGPFGTASEAQAITRLVNERDWDTIVLVTSRYNLFRSDRTLRRCAEVRVIEYGVDDPWWRIAIGVPLEWVKLGISETVRRGC